MKPINLVVTGSKGRMGQTIIGLANQDSELTVAGQVDMGDDINAVIGGANVVIDFSFHSATLGVAQAAAKNKKAMVIGTTGHSAEERSSILHSLSSVPTV